jgi:hypothetical protein
MASSDMSGGHSIKQASLNKIWIRSPHDARHIQDAGMSAIDLLGYSAGLAVLATFCMSSIVPLRIVAMVSNLLFVSYGLLAHLYPVFLLHAILLPINLLKLAQADLLLRNKNPIFGRALLSGLPSRKERV